jgi:hypothetical protein
MPAWTRTAVALLAFWLVGLGAAQAAWRAVEGIDVATGKPSLLLIGDLDVRTAIYARCVDGHAELFLDGFDGGDFAIAPVGPVNLVIATDTGKSWSSEARYGREKQGYITTTWLTRETISAVVAELAAAKSAISISIKFADSGDVSVWDTDAKGSTAAGRRFLEACPQTRFSGLPGPAAPAQPQAEPPAPPRPDPAPPVPELPPETPPGAGASAIPETGLPALPEMRLQVDDSGPVLRLTGRLDDAHVLTFNCDGNGSIVLIANDGQEATPSPDLAFNLSMTLDSGTTWTGLAKVRRLAPGYLGFYHVADEKGMWKLLGEVMAAWYRFDIRLQDVATGAEMGWSMAPEGFGTPTHEYYVQCMLNTFSPLPASSAEGAATWQTFTTEAAEATLVSELDKSARLLATCDSGKNVTLSLVAPDLPYQIGDVGLNLHLEIDGDDRLSTGEVFDAADGLTGVAYTGNYVATAIQALAEARTGVSLKVQNFADGSLVTWDAPNLDGLVAATNSFNATCFGTAPRQAVADAPVAPSAGPSRIQSDAGFDPNLDWTVAVGDQVTLPQVEAVLLGRAGPGPGMLQMTCGPDPWTWSLGFTTTDPSGAAIKASDGPFTIGLEVDGSPLAFPNAQFTETQSGISVIADAGTDIGGALIMMSLSFNPVTLTVTGASGEPHVYSVGIAGMGEASGAMSQACLG